MSEELNYVQLNEDDKAVALREIKNLSSNANLFHSMIANDKLSQELINGTLTTFSFMLDDLKKHLHFTEEEDQITKKLRENTVKKLRKEIEQLQNIIKNQDTYSALEFSVKEIKKNLSLWWRHIVGFSSIERFAVDEFGSIEVSFQPHMRDFVGSRYSSKPETRKKRQQQLKQSLKDKGFTLIEKHNDYELLDTSENKQLLIQLLRNQFPSIRIEKIESEINFDTSNINNDILVIKQINVSINSIDDFYKLKETIKSVEEIDNAEF